LTSSASASPQAGLLNHPHPLAPPEGYRSWRRGTDLYRRWQHGADGPALGAEAVCVSLFNAGYPLRDVVAELRGVDESGREVFRVERTIAEFPQGATAGVEVPSYELPGEVGDVEVSLISARFEHDSG